MKQAKNSFLQKRLADEAMAILGITGHDANVSEYQQAIRLVGKAFRVSCADMEEQLQRIEAARDEIARKCMGDVINDPIITDEIIVNWSAMQIHETVMALFEASVQLKRRADRRALLNMASQILDTECFEDWIMNLADDGSQTPEPDNDSSQIPELADDSSQTPELDNDSSQTPELADDGSQTPKQADDGSKTPEPDNDSSQTPELTDDSSQTPEPDNDSSQTPELTDDSSRTPEPNNDNSQMPELDNDNADS